MQGEGSGDDCVFELWGGRGGDEMLGRGDGGGVFGWLDLAVEDGYWCLNFSFGIILFWWIWRWIFGTMSQYSWVSDLSNGVVSGGCVLCLRAEQLICTLCVGDCECFP